MVSFRYCLDVPTTDEQIGRNLASLRGGMSQRELATRMRAAGFKWSHLTVASVERGDRPLRLSEASAIAELLELQGLQSITAPEGEFEYLVTEGKLKAAERELALRADEVLRLQRQMVEELNSMYTKDIDADAVRMLEWNLRTTPVEVVYEVLMDQLPMVRALAEEGGPFGAALLDGLVRTEVKSAHDITFDSKESADGKHPTTA